MRENRTYGSEGGEARAFPTPISSSLTFPGVPRSGSVVSSHSHERNRTDGRVRDAKPHDVGLQISRGFHPEISA
jgi:hypothetical protein